MRYAAMWRKYAVWWDRMAIKASRAYEFACEAQFAVAHKAIYLQAAAATVNGRAGVTWAHIAVLHRRESNADFSTYLGNGQPLNRRTTIVPRGRGPFYGPNAFVNGCVDALQVDGLTSVIDWRLEKILYYCETFNGWGYAAHGLPSPYIWGGTNIQRPGKYVSDGKFNPRLWDSQPGCAPMLATIAKLDGTVRFARED